MTADELSYVEETLLSISEASQRAAETAKVMRLARADPALVSAMEAADRELLDLHRRLAASAYYGVASEQQLRLSA